MKASPDSPVPREITPVAPAPAAAPTESTVALGNLLEEAQLSNSLSSYIRGLLDNETQPIELADVEQLVRENHAISRWPGEARNFEEFVRAQRIAVLPVSRGYVYDPTRHDPFAVRIGLGEGMDTLSAPLLAVIDLVTRNTRCPRLSPEQYRRLFHAISEGLPKDGAFVHGSSDPQALVSATEAVQGSYPVSDLAVSFNDITYVLESLRASNALRGEADNIAADDLADVFNDYLEAICADNRVPLTDEERTLLRLWVGADQIDTAEEN